ncbi:hypothetical protein BC829DRAFT_404048, partial [Chytridium lagenaria]
MRKTGKRPWRTRKLRRRREKQSLLNFSSPSHSNKNRALQLLQSRAMSKGTKCKFPHDPNIERKTSKLTCTPIREKKSERRRRLMLSSGNKDKTTPQKLYASTFWRLLRMQSTDGFGSAK